MDASLEKTIGQLLQRLTQMAEDSHASFQRIQADVQEIKDQRYKPYFASMGAFLVIVLGVMGYVYNLETRLTNLLFTMNAQVTVSGERLDALEKRLESRTNQMITRWDTHADRHASMDEGMRILVQRILDGTLGVDNAD